ncbi:MAG: lysine--tRNA ligase [Candidatus Woesearchaeota archaeon]
MKEKMKEIKEAVEDEKEARKTEELIIKEKQKKLEEIKKLKINPYPYRFDKKDNCADIIKKYSKLKAGEHTKEKAVIAGRLISIRRMGKLTFAHLQDQSGKIQILFKEENGKDIYELLKLIDAGDILGIEGIVFATKTGEVTIEVKNMSLLCKSLRPLPEKWHGLKDPEIRYRKRYLDLVTTPGVRDVFIKRAEIYKAIREFLDSRGFIEVQTPILQTQYGGANARPFVTKINAWNMKMYLRIAYELHLKRLLVGGFEKVYDLSVCFRNEGVDKTHNPEFSMMEIQCAYEDYNYAMELTEQLWEYVAKKVVGSTIIEYEGKKINLKTPWQRITVKDAIKKYANIDVDKYSDSELKDFVNTYSLQIKGDLTRGSIITALFEELVEDKLIQPTHVIDHPRESSPLAKPHRKNPQLVERVEPFINGWEVGNCYSELTDPILQKKLLQEQAEKGRGGDEEAHPMDEDYIIALEHGLPPNVGIGVGVDRMVMLLTNSKTIRDVILFPIIKPESNPDK